MVSASEIEEQTTVQHQFQLQEPAHATASTHSASATLPPSHTSMHQTARVSCVASSSFQPVGQGQSSLFGWQASIQGWVLAAAILFAIRLSRQQTDDSRMDVRALQVTTTNFPLAALAAQYVYAEHNLAWDITIIQGRYKHCQGLCSGTRHFGCRVLSAW